jgi:hypothetical protein
MNPAELGILSQQPSQVGAFRLSEMSFIIQKLFREWFWLSKTSFEYYTCAVSIWPTSSTFTTNFPYSCNATVSH